MEKRIKWKKPIENDFVFCALKVLSQFQRSDLCVEFPRAIVIKASCVDYTSSYKECEGDTWLPTLRTPMLATMKFYFYYSDHSMITQNGSIDDNPSHYKPPKIKVCDMAKQIVQTMPIY